MSGRRRLAVAEGAWGGSAGARTCSASFRSSGRMHRSRLKLACRGWSLSDRQRRRDPSPGTDRRRRHPGRHCCCRRRRHRRTAGFDTVVWIPVLTTLGKAWSAPFFTEMEAWMFANYATYAVTRVEWSKDWAFTATGPWTDTTTLGARIPGSFRGGYRNGAQHPRRAWDPRRTARARSSTRSRERGHQDRSGAFDRLQPDPDRQVDEMVGAAFEEPVVLADGDIRREVVCRAPRSVNASGESAASRTTVRPRAVRRRSARPPRRRDPVAAQGPRRRQRRMGAHPAG